MIFHVLNRGVGRMRLFRGDADFEAFERILARTLACANFSPRSHGDAEPAFFIRKPENQGIR
jgi:hypothetical protein